MNDKSRPIYPPEEGGNLENYMGIDPMYDGVWDVDQETEVKAPKTKNHIRNRQDYKMEIGEEITFDDLNEDNLNNESQVDIDSIIRNMDMSDHNYRDNNW